MNKRKLLQQMLNNQKNVKFSDFVTIIEAFGFFCTRTGGSHKIFKNESINEIMNIQNVNGEAKPYQIKQFFYWVEKHDLEMED